MKILYAFLMVMSIHVVATSQDLSIVHIPAGLLKEADLVKRHETRELIIKSPKQAVIRHSYAYTILNDRADAFG